ncbi:ribosylglycohydrolase [Candidatus Poribacteria bacterium]|nr:MAG: ribosylglycohydrolase [Candidatus Poribacteria bacterium]
MKDGGTWNTIAGQPTDDSELALMLARTLVKKGIFDREAIREAYLFWFNSRPFDIGSTTAAGLRNRSRIYKIYKICRITQRDVLSPTHVSERLANNKESNGALMRVSPLGIFGTNDTSEQVAEWARQDAAITHIHPVCQTVSALFAMAIAYVIRTGCNAETLYAQIVAWADEINRDESLIWKDEIADAESIRKAIRDAQDAPPADFYHQQGWVLIAFQNALYRLIHAPNTEEAIIDTVMSGGDTDTNAAICGALLGAVNGLESIPERWQETLRNCRPEAGKPGVHQPRPECFWPVDALELAEKLVSKQAA